MVLSLQSHLKGLWLLKEWNDEEKKPKGQEKKLSSGINYKAAKKQQHICSLYVACMLHDKYWELWGIVWYGLIKCVCMHAYLSMRAHAAVDENSIMGLILEQT